jgi:Fe-S-cluster containining protein
MYLPGDIKEITEDYVNEFMPGGWTKTKNREIVQEDGSTNEGCCFLDDEGKKCTIYGARPVQCRTYPWWPRLLFNETTWNAEAVLPDKKWTASEGGCEGIINNRGEAGAVDNALQSPTVIHRNKALYEYYTDAFPFMRGGGGGGKDVDKSRVLSKVEVILAVIKSTKAWVKDFVIKYALCPFADSVFGTDRIRYRVYFGGVRDAGGSRGGERQEDLRLLIDRVKYEMLDLLSCDEDDVATTLLMLPFAFQSFQEWNAFTMQLEDEVMPLLEQEARVHAVEGSVHGRQSGQSSSRGKRRSLLQKLKDTDAAAAKRDSQANRKCPAMSQSSAAPGSTSPLPDIQLAFFHPMFAWADTSSEREVVDFNTPINFEKRAPFPTINLLRAATVREYADQQCTSKIANDNAAALESAENLADEFENIIKLALS